MIILIEGVRGTGKTTLLDNYFKQNTNDNIVYYKFAFSDYIKNLGFEDQEKGPGVHYFSISNILTILEISNTLLKDKHIVFDRSIFSAYVWSIYRNRLPKKRLIEEFKKILDSSIYNNCKVIRIENEKGHVPEERNKEDIFNKYESFNEEDLIYKEVFSEFAVQLTDSSRNNELVSFTNKKDDNSFELFNNLLDKIVDK